jgi:hypothetical protein
MSKDVPAPVTPSFSQSLPSHLVGAATELTKTSVRQLPQLTNDVDLLAHQDEYSCENG